MGGLCGVDQLGIDAEVAARPADAPLQYVAHPQLAADLLRVNRFIPISERSVARDHEQVRDPRQIGRQILDDAVGEVLLHAVVAEIGKRKDDNRYGSNRGYFSERLQEPSQSDQKDHHAASGRGDNAARKPIPKPRHRDGQTADDAAWFGWNLRTPISLDNLAAIGICRGHRRGGGVSLRNRCRKAVAASWNGLDAAAVGAMLIEDVA